jgi:DinB superfamily
MKHELENTIALLERTPAALDALLRGLPEVWTETNEGENTWSVSNVVAHLIHCEHENWMPRARHILHADVTEAFPPFNREGHVRYKVGETGSKTLPQLLDKFARARAKGLEELRGLNLTSQDLERRARHPALGTVTLGELLATWAAHDLTHLHQITRIMAHQVREAVGPWVRFLGVMQCAGHSEAA